MTKIENTGKKPAAIDVLNVVGVLVPIAFVFGSWVFTFFNPTQEARVGLIALAATSVFGFSLSNLVRNFDLAKKFEKFVADEKGTEATTQLKIDGVLAQSRILASFVDGEDLSLIEEYARWLSLNRALEREEDAISSLCKWQRDQMRDIISGKIRDCRAGEILVDQPDKEINMNTELLLSVKKGSSVIAVSFEDVPFWESSYGKSLLETQRKVISEGVNITRIFVTTAEDNEKISPIMDAQVKAGIEVYYIDLAKVRQLKPDDVVIYGENLVRRGRQKEEGVDSVLKTATIHSSKSVVTAEIARSEALKAYASRWLQKSETVV
jgi:hypothetical protein